MLRTGELLKGGQELDCQSHCGMVAEPYGLKQNVLNRGAEGRMPGQGPGSDRRLEQSGSPVEHSDFKGEHVVECYFVENGVVVARDRVDVPISNTSAEASAVS